MLRVLIALAIGVAVAFGSSFAVVQGVANATPEPVNKPLYNYGSR